MPHPGRVMLTNVTPRAPATSCSASSMLSATESPRSRTRDTPSSDSVGSRGATGWAAGAAGSAAAGSDRTTASEFATRKDGGAVAPAVATTMNTAVVTPATGAATPRHRPVQPAAVADRQFDEVVGERGDPDRDGDPQRRRARRPTVRCAVRRDAIATGQCHRYRPYEMAPTHRIGRGISAACRIDRCGETTSMIIAAVAMREQHVAAVVQPRRRVVHHHHGPQTEAGAERPAPATPRRSAVVEGDQLSRTIARSAPTSSWLARASVP